ncbi:hypothetical protein OUZ56_029371 [Daphnia magna]|uniref:Uncharacterized protein n=1 Tax=Daphnia magna TaxID=35525 RepID=A0ABR0B6M7_9CRUS|nr:hypothetical protein OUZ56_029371 [Daphnia magna]
MDFLRGVEQHTRKRRSHQAENHSFALTAPTQKPGAANNGESTSQNVNNLRPFTRRKRLDANSPHRNPETICSSGKTDD